MRKILLLSVFLFFAPIFHFAQVQIMQRSHTPPLLFLNSLQFPQLQSYGLLSTADTLPLSPSFRFAGTADGAGFLRNSDGSFLMTVNHEDNRSVSRIRFDSTLRPMFGDYLMNSDAGYWRLCSATMATPEIHGFGPYFLSGSEENLAFVHYVNPYGPAISNTSVSFASTLAEGLGEWRVENAVPLPLNAFNKTVIIIGDDDAGTHGGQLVMYIGNAVGDLENGKLFVLRRTDLNQRERDILPGQSYPVEFAAMPAGANLWTSFQSDIYSDTALKCIRFNRIEDLDYRKGSAADGREIYFNASGLANPDTVDRTLWGRVYRLRLDSIDPTKGMLECVLNGDDKSPSNDARMLYNPDNICVTEDYVYVQEDPNQYGFVAAWPYVHDARVYQYDIASGRMVPLVEMDQRRHAPDSATYNVNGIASAFQYSGTGSWEFGAMLDISDAVGIPRTFTLNLQTHTWRDSLYMGLDGGTRATLENQGSMVVLLSGVPRIRLFAPTVSGDTICAGESTTLNASGGTRLFATNGTTYHWYTDTISSSPIFTGSNFTTAPLYTTTTYYVATAADGIVDSVRVPVTVVVNPIPAQPVVSVFGQYLVSSAASGNQWFLFGLPIPNAQLAAYYATQSGLYSVQSTINNCSSPLSDEVFIDMSVITATPQALIFPNPSDGLVNIVTDGVTKIEISDAAGRKVFVQAFASATAPFQFDTSELSDGVYFLDLYGTNGITHHIFVKKQ